MNSLSSFTVPPQCRRYGNYTAAEVTSYSSPDEFLFIRSPAVRHCRTIIQSVSSDLVLFFSLYVSFCHSRDDPDLCGVRISDCPGFERVSRGEVFCGTMSPEDYRAGTVCARDRWKATLRRCCIHRSSKDRYTHRTVASCAP